ncbi:MAG TPA: RHS repeat-associated core domain-containing protein, partial [Bacteroidia bacterium]|nr:RHS repeat-associated core domain-containing protein [Bacteroidia bacterium]
AMDYYYTMQGWIRGVNSEALSNKNDPGKDAYTETGGGDPNAYSTTQHNLHALVGLDNFAYSLGYYEQSSKTINTVSTTLHKDYSPIKNGSSYGYQPLTDPMGDPSTLLASGTYSPYLTSLYNGNIKHMGTTIVNAAPNYMVQALLQGFTYDQLNRITNSASFYAYTGTTNTTGGMIDNTSGNSNFNIWPILSGAINTSATSYTYEANGNIQHLTRNQYNNSSTTFSLIDDIAYTYSNNPSLVNPNSGSGYTNTNKLKVAADAASVSSGLDLVSGQLLSPANYDYDDIGNLVQDNQEGLSNIVWNVYGKIESVTHNTSSGKHDLEFRYDSKGNRIMKIDKPRSSTTPYGPLNQSNWVYTIYERDAQGNVLATYELKYIAQGGSLYSKSLTLLEHDIYGGKRIGLYNRSTENISNNSLLFTGDLTTGVFTNINTNPPDPIFSQKNIYSFGLTNNYGQKRYELVNHLDNVMNVVSDNKIGQVSGTTIAYYKADPYRATDYYAFGQPMADRNFANDEGTYRYGFNGKEQDDEVHGQAGGSYDFDARMYDPRLGRWLSIDPCFKRYSANSPYTYALNSPIILFDNDGRLVTFANAASEKAFNEHYAAADAATQAKLDKLKSSDVIYHVDVTANLPNGYNGNTQYDFAKGAKGVDFVSVNISSTISAAQKVSALGDELETASQFENGDIGFAQKPDGSTATLGYDLADEAATKKASIDAVHNYNKKYGTNYGLDKAEQNFEKALNDPIPTGKTRSDVIDDYFNNDPTGKLYKQTVDPRATSVKVHIGGDGGLNDAQIQNAVLGGVIKAAVLRYFNPSSKKQETSYTGPK